MDNLPVYNIIPLFESFFLEKNSEFIMNDKIKKSIEHATKLLRKSQDANIRWALVRYKGHDHPILLKSYGANEVIIHGPSSLRMKKAKTEKDLEYWKKQILNILKAETMVKSLGDIMYPMGIPEDAVDLLQKARGFPVGTIREWSGKKYKKLSSGKWVRSYTEAESRGAKQAVRNVKRKILNAKSMEELLEIVSANMSRFKDESGKTLPIIKEFMSVARETVPGKKEKEDDIVGEEELTETNTSLPEEIPSTNYEENENIVNKKNMFVHGSQVAVDGKKGRITSAKFVDNKTEYTVVFEDGSSGKYNNISLEPFEGVLAQNTIESANPTNRTLKTMELSGTVEEDEERSDKEVQEEQSEEPFKPEIKKIDINVHKKARDSTEEDTETSIQINTVDYSSIESIRVGVKPLSAYKKAYSDEGSAKDKVNSLLAVKPDYIPPLDLTKFSKNGHTLIFSKLEENKYLIPMEQSFRPAAAYSYGAPSVEEISGKGFFVVNLDVLAATQDYYRKVAKVIHDENQKDKEARIKEKYGADMKIRKKRLKIMSSNRMMYDQQFIQESFMGDSRKEYWSTYGKLQDELKQKSWDLQTMQEEIENSFSKGRETSYGESNTSNMLQESFGVKIKRQDGSKINREDAEYISSALESVQKTFGDRKSINNKIGLKVSFAKGTAMHARKAVGVYIPTLKTIGISDGKGLSKKDPMTGKTVKVDYGDANFGGFVLSHEYAHMIDNYLGSKGRSWFQTDDYNSPAGKVASTFRAAMKQPQKKESSYFTRTSECFARALEQYHAMETAGDEAMSFSAPYVDTMYYCDKDIFNTEIKPLIDDFFKENESMLKSITIEI